MVVINFLSQTSPNLSFLQAVQVHVQYLIKYNHSRVTKYTGSRSLRFIETQGVSVMIEHQEREVSGCYVQD